MPKATTQPNCASRANEAVSVVLLTHNNKDMLRETLSHVLRLEWPGLEVIVVDNVSSDRTSDMIEQEFGGAVRVIRRTVDSITAGRNEGFRSAKGEFILSIDDDMIIEDVHAIEKAVAVFRRFPDVGLLTLNVSDPDLPGGPNPFHWWHPVPIETGKNRFFYTDFILEGAVVVRKSVVRDTGGYDDEFFGCFEGVDWAFRLIREDIKILYCPTISCVELRVRRGRDAHSASARNYWLLRNKLWTVWKNYPVRRAIWYAAPRIALAGYQACRYGWGGIFLKALRDGIFAPPSIRVRRRPLDRQSWGKVREIRKGQFCAFEGTPDTHTDARVAAGPDSGRATAAGAAPRIGDQPQAGKKKADIATASAGNLLQRFMGIWRSAKKGAGELQRSEKPCDEDAGWFLTVRQNTSIGAGDGNRARSLPPRA